MAASADDDDMRSEAPSTCGHWTASDDEDEEEVVVVGDVATLLPNENVNKIDVCESGVWHMYETIEVESKAVDTGIAYEIEVEYEEMPQAQEAQDVVVPPSGGSEEVRIRLKDSSSHPSSSSAISGSSTVTDKTIRKSTRHGKKRMVLDSEALEIDEVLDQRETILHKFGFDFLVKKNDKPKPWWVHEDDLRESHTGCEAWEVFDKKFSKNKVSDNNKRRRK